MVSANVGGGQGVSGKIEDVQDPSPEVAEEAIRGVIGRGSRIVRSKRDAGPPLPVSSDALSCSCLRAPASGQELCKQRGLLAFRIQALA